MTAATTTSWEQYVAAGEALNERFAEVAPMPDGATSGDYWTPVQNEPGVYYRNVEWGDVWSAGKEVVAAAVGVQYSDDRPIEQHISFESDDINGNGQMVEVTFDTAARLVDVLTTVIAGAI